MVRLPRALASLFVVLSLGVALLALQYALRADTTLQMLPFFQDWSNASLLTTDDDWSTAPGIVGYRGDQLAATTGVDPQTILAEFGAVGPVVDVNANQTNPSTFTAGGVAEFALPDPAVALQGSGTARAPHIVFNLSTLGHFSIRVRYNLRDIDGSADNAVQPVALQYRIGTSGSFVNVPAAFVPDATTGPSLATLVTPVDVTLPPAVDNQFVVQLRILTADAVGSDEWVGVDDITVTAADPSSPTGIGAAVPDHVGVGEMSLLTVSVTPGSNPTSTGLLVTANLALIGGLDMQPFFDDGTNGDVTAEDHIFSYLAFVSSGTPGAKALPATITDAEARSGFAEITLNVEAPTDPSVAGSAVPNLVGPGSSVKLLATVTPGAHPSSTELTATADLTAIGGSSVQPLFDDGTNGDLTAGDNVFSVQAVVALATPNGPKVLPLSVADAEGRSGTGSIALTVVGTPPSDPQPLPFAQSWSDIGLITANNDWTAVPGIVGYRGDDLTTATATDPQTIVADGSLTPLNVLANQTNPNTVSTGAVAEFHLANPTIALQGSGTADAPHIVAKVNALGHGSIRVSYTLRDIDGSTDNAVQPVALQYRLGSAGPFTNVPEAFVADATGGPSLAVQVTPVSVLLPEGAGNVPELQLRWITTNAAGNDEWVGIDDIVVIEDNTTTNPTGVAAADPNVVPQGAATLLTVKTAPGRNPTSTDIAASVMLNAGGGWDPLYDDGSNGDVTAGDGIFSFEYSLALTAPTGPTELPVLVSDAQGRSSTTSVSFTVVPPPPPPAFTIAQVQGGGSSSTYVAQVVSVRGVVTGLKSNGFFLQTEEGADDGDPGTSEGIFVFTSSAPPPVAKVGRLVDVTGMVHEFVPAADPVQPPLTELASPTVTLVSNGNALPSPVLLGPADTTPDGGLEQLEKYEGMRVQVSSMTVTGPTLGSVNEANATGTSNGVFYGVLTGIARPFREPGLEVPNPLPVGAPATVPRFDGNPERLQVDTNGQVGAAAFDVAAGDIVTNIVGPLDYSFRTYLILPDPATPPGVIHVTNPVPVSAPSASQFTVASANLERFFDAADDPLISEPVLTSSAFANRLNKASLFFRSVLRTPDIVGVEEVENLSTLQTLAAKINADASAAGDPDPQYQAFLEEGNDVGGIDVGFLVKASRLTVVDVTQIGKDSVYINPNNGQPELLNDRPSLVLRATVPNTPGPGFPLTVIVNHLRSLGGAEDPVDGNRVRTKRRAQAEELARLIQSRQAADPNEHMISIGDYNAFQFNDGLVDSIGTIRGVPAAADQVTLPSPDLVDPDLVDLVDTAPPEQRYSFVFDGNAQELDHILVTQNLGPYVDRLEYGRVDADFPEVARNDANSPVRLSDHDPIVAYFSLPSVVVPEVSVADVSVVENSTAATFTVALSEPTSSPVAVDYQTADGSAHAPDDYAGGGGTLVFAPGETEKDVTISINDDNLNELAETFAVVFSNPANARFPNAVLSIEATGTIVDDDPLPHLAVDDVTVQEPGTGSTTANFTVRLSPASGRTVSITYATVNGTAIAGSDYLISAGTLTFAPGETAKVVPVTVLADAVNEPIQTFAFALLSPTNATISDAFGAGAIYDANGPRIDGFAPGVGTIGSVVTITGHNFTSILAVRFNGIAALFTVTSPASINALVPANATDGPVSVVGLSGIATSADRFLVAPKIVGVTPLSGDVGAVVTIVGNGFSGVEHVRFNGTDASIHSSSATSIQVIVPPGATTGKISVTTPNGTALSTLTFLVAPRITSFSPGSGPAGTVVDIVGANFSGVTSVQFGGAATLFTVVSPTLVRAIVPGAAPTGPISVTTLAGTATSASTFLVLPRIVGFGPTSGPVGTVVMIAGTSLDAATSVSFAGTPAPFFGFSLFGLDMLVTSVPAGAVTGPISVATPTATAVSAGPFTVMP